MNPESNTTSSSSSHAPPPPVRFTYNALREPLTKAQAALFDSCQGLVRSLAWRTQTKMGKMIELDDLIAYGQLGLVEAARKFDAGRGLAFTTFAHYRIRGAILDGLEKHRWFNRSAFHSSRYEYLASDFLVAEDQAARAEGDGPWLVNASRSLAVSYLLSSDAVGAAAAMVEDDGVRPPGADLMNEELRTLMRRAIDSLPTQVAQLIRSTYFEGLNIKEAGERLGVSKAWASRLHARALGLLAARLKHLGYEH